MPNCMPACACQLPRQAQHPPGGASSLWPARVGRRSAHSSCLATLWQLTSKVRLQQVFNVAFHSMCLTTALAATAAGASPSPSPMPLLPSPPPPGGRRKARRPRRRLAPPSPPLPLLLLLPARLLRRLPGRKAATSVSRPAAPTRQTQQGFRLSVCNCIDTQPGLCFSNSQQHILYPPQSPRCSLCASLKASSPKFHHPPENWDSQKGVSSPCRLPCSA